MIGNYADNELLAMQCAACRNPILPGQLYVNSHIPSARLPAHETCIQAMAAEIDDLRDAPLGRG